MGTPSSILDWKIPRTEEPGRLQAMGLQSRTRLITRILTSGRKHTLSSQGPPWGRCKMCMCWGFQGSKQSRCCWHTQMKTCVTREIRADCLEEAVPKPGPNLAREKCFRRGSLAGSATEMLQEWAESAWAGPC